MPEPDRLSTIEFYGRAARLITHVLAGLLLATAVRLDFTGRLKPEPLVNWWTRIMLRIFGIRIQLHGTPLSGGHVCVANHVSWLDIPLIGAVAGTRFVSKSEVQHWPVAGWLADAAGTFYLRRGHGGARPLLTKLTPHLQAGGSVTIFPEGTTTDGSGVLPFHPRLFAAAIEAELPVQAVGLRYGLASDGAMIAPFIGEDELVSHLLRLLRNRSLTAEIHYCEPIAPGTHNRESLARAAQAAICGVLDIPAYPPPVKAAPTMPLEELAGLNVPC